MSSLVECGSIWELVRIIFIVLHITSDYSASYCHYNFLFLGKHYGKPVDWMDSTGKELTLWQRMLERPNLWGESCITLRPSLDRTAVTNNTTT